MSHEPILFNILSFLTPHELGVAAEVCKHWKLHARQQMLWFRLSKVRWRVPAKRRWTAAHALDNTWWVQYGEWHRAGRPPGGRFAGNTFAIFGSASGRVASHPRGPLPSITSISSSMELIHPSLPTEGNRNQHVMSDERSQASSDASRPMEMNAVPSANNATPRTAASDEYRKLTHLIDTSDKTGGRTGIFAWLGVFHTEDCTLRTGMLVEQLPHRTTRLHNWNLPHDPLDSATGIVDARHSEADIVGSILTSAEAATELTADAIRLHTALSMAQRRDSMSSAGSMSSDRGGSSRGSMSMNVHENREVGGASSALSAINGNVSQTASTTNSVTGRKNSTLSNASGSVNGIEYSSISAMQRVLGLPKVEFHSNVEATTLPSDVAIVHAVVANDSTQRTEDRAVGTLLSSLSISSVSPLIHPPFAQQSEHPTLVSSYTYIRLRIVLQNALRNTVALIDPSEIFCLFWSGAVVKCYLSVQSATDDSTPYTVISPILAVNGTAMTITSPTASDRNTTGNLILLPPLASVVLQLAVPVDHLQTQQSSHPLTTTSTSSSTAVGNGVNSSDPHPRVALNSEQDVLDALAAVLIPFHTPQNQLEDTPLTDVRTETHTTSVAMNDRVPQAICICVDDATVWKSYRRLREGVWALTDDALTTR